MVNLETLQPIANRVIDQYFKAGLASLDPRDRMFFLIWSYGGLLGNGGHAAFFYNSGADDYVETLDALQQLDLTVFADLLRRAGYLLFKDDVPRDMTDRNAIIDGLPEDDPALDDELSTLDDAFFSNGGSDKALETLESWYTHTPK
jgi:hypothetical protein